MNIILLLIVIIVLTASHYTVFKIGEKSGMNLKNRKNEMANE